jgi:predicted Zn finger-like uncharacterized protein
MDVRCERCRAQYVFDDEQVTAAGITVRCTNCGHVFRVKKKELVVTVPVKPDEMEGTPLPASAAASRPTAAVPAAAPEAREQVREWRVRQANGNIFTFRELTTLQKWIIERKVGRDDEISHSGDQWKRLGNIAELASFFQVVEAAERGRSVPPVTPVGMPAAPVFGLPLPPPGPGPYPPPPSGYPPPSFTLPAAGRRPPPPERRVEPLPGDLGAEIDLAPEELAAVKKGRGRRLALLVVALLAAGGAAAYALAPQLFPVMRRPSEPAAPPVAVEPRPEPRPPEPAPPAEAPPAPVPAPAPERSAEAPPAAAGKPAAARGPKALLAQAARLREKGDLEAALDLFGRVAADDPENVEALTGRGLCYLDLERYPPAEASFQAALGIDPRQPDALLGLAETYRWQGKKTDAIRYYEKYLAANPDGEEAEVARNALEELRK